MNSNPSSLPIVDDCEGCGACCLHMGFPSYVQGNEVQGYDAQGNDVQGNDVQGNEAQAAEKHWVSMPAELKQELMAFMQSYQRPAEGELDGPCIWFDPQKRVCIHHEHRPNVCRDFKVGGKDCIAWRKHYADRIV